MAIRSAINTPVLYLSPKSLLLATILYPSSYLIECEFESRAKIFYG